MPSHKPVTRECPGCNVIKTFRADNRTCGCRGTGQEKETELKETIELSGDRGTISLPRTNIHTLDQLVEFCHIDLSIWEVERFVANKWEMGFKNEETGKADSLPLYQVKAFLRKKKEIADARKEIEELKKLAKQFARLPISVRKVVKETGNMLEINIADHHFGKLAWGEETGGPNYDVKIASEVFERALNTILDRASALEYDEIWFVVGNDLMNSDDTQGRTTKGTYVSTDIRYHKTFSTVRNIVIAAIERLRTLTKLVKVVMVSGNHDHLSVWHLGDSLECYFHNYKDVVIDNSPKYFKFHEFGKCMVLFTHGDSGKRKDFPLLMATEEPEMFGRTLYREAHTGHNHTENVVEQHGVRVRILSSLGPSDAWHAKNAYVGNLRRSEAFQWNREQGLIGTVIYTDRDELIESPTATKKVAKKDKK